MSQKNSATLITLNKWKKTPYLAWSFFSLKNTLFSIHPTAHFSIYFSFIRKITDHLSCQNLCFITATFIFQWKSIEQNQESKIRHFPILESEYEYVIRHLSLTADGNKYVRKFTCCYFILILFGFYIASSAMPRNRSPVKEIDVINLFEGWLLPYATVFFFPMWHDSPTLQLSFVPLITPCT